MTATALLSPATAHTNLVKLAREIAIDHYPIEDILKRHSITPERWDVLKDDPRFNALLASEVEAWQSALNTAERTKLKAGALIEEWLEEANGRLYAPGENLNAKVELAKLLARIAGIGVTGVGVEGAQAERVSVTINLGGDAKLLIEKQLPGKVIDATPTE